MQIRCIRTAPLLILERSNLISIPVAVTTEYIIRNSSLSSALDSPQHSCDILALTVKIIDRAVVLEVDQHPIHPLIEPDRLSHGNCPKLAMRRRWNVCKITLQLPRPRPPDSAPSVVTRVFALDDEEFVLARSPLEYYMGREKVFAPRAELHLGPRGVAICGSEVIVQDVIPNP